MNRGRPLAFVLAIATALAAASMPATAVEADRAAAPRPVPLRPAHTYSIVARDPATGDLGVAVQSHWFSVGSSVTWAEPGVGAVATQSFVEPAYGPRGLELMRTGVAAPDALARLVAADPHPDVRQVAMVDAQGRVAAHTGKLCIPAAGQQTGSGFSVQANLMLDASVWPAMARAFESTKGDLAERMLAALEAAEAQGGDLRGRQSAALLVVRGTKSDKPWADRLFDLRVEDHPRPLAELRRLVRLARAYRIMTEGDDAVAAGRMDDALRLYATAEEMEPDNHEFVFWHAVGLASTGRVDDSLPVFRRAFLAHPAWVLLVPRLAEVGLLPADAGAIRRIVASGPTPGAGTPPATDPRPGARP